MPRGRPRKIETVAVEDKPIQLIIAEVAHDNCGLPGCTTKNHLAEASEVIDALKDNGFIITELRK